MTTEPREPTQPDPVEPPDTDDLADDPAMNPQTREHLQKLGIKPQPARPAPRNRNRSCGRHGATAEQQRAEVERIAGQVLIDPADVWRVNSDTSQAFIDAEFHKVSGDNVVEAAKALAASKPHLAKPPAGPPPSDRPIEGLRPGATPSDAKPVQPTWASALRGR